MSFRFISFMYICTIYDLSDRVIKARTKSNKQRKRRRPPCQCDQIWRNIAIGEKISPTNSNNDHILTPIFKSSMLVGK
jgi:hypothetical protein